MRNILITREVTDCYSITEGEYWIVRHLCKNAFFIEAIKFIRMQYGHGLYEAKKICEAIRDADE